MERFILKKLLDWKNFPYRKLDDDVLNIPLFMAEQAERLIGLALEQRRVASKDSYSLGFSGRRLVQGYFKWCRERGYH